MTVGFMRLSAQSPALVWRKLLPKHCENDCLLFWTDKENARAKLFLLADESD